MMHLILNNLDYTKTFALKLSSELKKGDFLCLKGDLGAGKTTLAQYLIRDMMGNLNEDVPSPTFTLVQTYESMKGTVWHYDLYRVNFEQELFELGMEEALSEGIVLVEWPDRLGSFLPKNYLEITFDIIQEGRSITLKGFGDWEKRLEKMSF